MKKLILLSLIFITVFSCGDEVQFNSPAFQGNRDGDLWRASSFSAIIDTEGTLLITGSNNVGSIKLKIPSAIEGVYVTGSVEGVEAEYIDSFGTIFSTNNKPDESVSVYPELGEIRLNEILNNEFSGSFRFTAFDEEGLYSVNFTGGLADRDPITDEPIFGGVFYRVPLVSGAIPNNPITCEDVEMDSEVALLAYQTTFNSSLDFIDSGALEVACSAYAQALATQRTYCGDTDGAVQSMIDALGSCQITCEQAMANRGEAESQYVTATISNFDEKCAQYLFYLQEQIEFCGDADGSVQAAIDMLNCGDDDGDGIPTAFEDFNNDGDFENDDTDGDDIPNYLDTDDDGDGILTMFEVMDEEGNPGDTDGDGDVDYLDNDDDGDGILTINENADPDGDGDPLDATDTDGNGVPDYLQA